LLKLAILKHGDSVGESHGFELILSRDNGCKSLSARTLDPVRILTRSARQAASEVRPAAAPPAAESGLPMLPVSGRCSKAASDR
jgi:hypothetical protein